MKKAFWTLAIALVGIQAYGQTTSMATYTLTVAQLTACNSTPISLFGPTAGTAYVPVRASLLRTGDRYATQPGDLVIRYVTSAPFVHMRLDLASGGILTTRRAWLAFFGSTGRYGTDDAFPVDIGGKEVQLQCQVGNPTVDVANPGSDVDLVLIYETWPTPTP